MNHMETHRLERLIAGVLEKGFLRQPQPEGKGFDKADCVQAAHDIAEMLEGEYFLDEKKSRVESETPDISKMMGLPPLPEFPRLDKTAVLADALNKLAGGLEDFRDAFKGFVIKDHPTVQAAGIGGGMGEVKR